MLKINDSESFNHLTYSNMHTIPYLSFSFFAITFFALYLFIRTIKNASKDAHKILIGMIVWLTIQGILTFNGFYSTNTDSLPPRIVLTGILPAMLFVASSFFTSYGRKLIDRLSLVHLTYIHLIRIPVELVLYGLYLEKTIPELMTFEGRNYDIFAGLTAPFIAYGISNHKIAKKALLIWNFMGLGLLLNIVVNAIRSAPSPIQKFAFYERNIAILHFPFSWLPTFVVPVVLWAHLVSIRQLINKKASQN